MLRKLKAVLMIGVMGAVVGALFATLAFGLTSYRIWKGMIVGVLITSLSAAMEMFVFDAGLKRLKFSSVLLIRTLFYILLISSSTLIVVLTHESLVHEEGLADIIGGPEFREFLGGDFISIFAFAVVGSFIINLVWQMNTLLGKGVLLSYLTGKYHTPKEENLIFMFLDLKSSTTIAEESDPLNYHQLLNQFFTDITPPVLESKGDIYQYVGDEVIIKWQMRDALPDANCLRCFFRIQDAITSKRESYLKKFGRMPEFKAGMHCGKVVAGEVGDAKREIVFHGDVMNTTSRIQSQCNIMNVSFLVSADVLGLLVKDHGFEVTPKGKIRLKGKQKEVELFSVDRSRRE